MFSGLIGLHSNGNCIESGRLLLQRCEVTEGSKETAGESSRKRLRPRPGYMRGDLPRQQRTTSGEEEEEEEVGPRTGWTARIRNGGSGHPVKEGPSGIADPPSTLGKRPSPADKELKIEGRMSWPTQSCSSSFPLPPAPVESSATKGPFRHLGETGQSGSDLRSSPGQALTQRCLDDTKLTQNPGDSFSSSFSFIQLSLSTTTTDLTLPGPHPTDQSSPQRLTSKPVSVSGGLLAPEVPHAEQSSNEPLTSPQIKPQMSPIIDRPLPKELIWGQTQPPPAPAGHNQRDEPPPAEKFWQGGGRWGGGGMVLSDLPDCDACSLDMEFASSLSVDSDTTSASSVTSGYESATPASDQGWDHIVKKYEGILQECLQNNRANTKIESMMLKLQRLQQKAILDDDYDMAENFGKKLTELCRERSGLKLGLPSRQPSVTSFLRRLTQAVNSALQREDNSQSSEAPEPDERSLYKQLNQRDRLLQEKRLVEAETVELQRRLAEMKEHRRRLEEQIQQEGRGAESEEMESSVLRGCSVDQLRDMSRALHDLVTSESRTHISVSPSPSVLRLQEQEKALNLSIKESTAKVMMSQRLGGSLRRKVSETETQLLALHEAKLAAISGNDFGSAKELKAEMRAAYQERDRLDGLARRLQKLSCGNSQELARMKEQQQQIRGELEQREAQHESLLKDNTAKYIELLEDRLHSCGCPALEKVWEADLEACHLFLQGLQLRSPSYSGPDTEEIPNAASYPQARLSTKEEEDCAMLTALGGRWCPEANLQHSEFTKKLEEFLFCMEDVHTEDEPPLAVDLTERCELISDRLMTLEDQLQTAIISRDPGLTQSLEQEVREMKAALQAMLAQLEEEDEEEDEEETRVQDCDHMDNGIEGNEEEEEEDQYFSDSWDI